MASKMFTGGMPELMDVILNNLNNDSYSLYSCTLVNRYWCKMSIPVLWKDPFSFKQKPLFISNYLSFLDKDEKFILKKLGINAEFSKTLFHYARFLKILDISHLEDRIKQWIELQFVDLKSYYRPLEDHIRDLLLKLFIESGATLHKLDIYFYQDNGIRPEIFYTLGRNMQFFSQLQELTLRIVSDFGNKNCNAVLKMLAENVTTFLKILAKIATKINVLKIEELNPNYGPQVFHALISVIKSQKRLRQFHLLGLNTPKKFHGIVSALESQKQSLREVLIEDCDYNAEFKALINCENLEIIRVRSCEDKELVKMLKMFNCKITTLEITNLDIVIDASNIVLILEKSGTLLQRLKLEVQIISEQSLLLETLMSFCPNILYLNLSEVEFSTQLLDFIGKLKNLQFLTLEWCGDIFEEDIIQFAN
ncbi:hypothetical protein F8M41_020980 [Gigaspora margarita]|uniref:F-box domain-containing protein n=1 Tax=Gigaspora margarita TaxID=4874 RepID=A0A8H4AHH8_GIGMA|nr:hypothetical protein F8M41_020980 [Gigaspora margarita]